MERYFHYAGLGLCLFALWAMVRHDWLRLTRPTRRAIGTVTGHNSQWSDGDRAYAARIAFTGDDGQCREVTDQMLRAAPVPPVGSMIEVAWPAGRPDLARIPRPVMWTLVYGTVTAMGGVLAARLLGWIGG